MTRGEATVMCDMANIALRAVKKDGAPGPGDRYRRVLADAVRTAPHAAAGCKELLRFTRLSREINELVSSMDATGPPAAADNRAQWITPAQAGELLDLKPDSVRKALRRGRLPGVRTECGWRIDRREVARWARRSAASTC